MIYSYIEGDEKEDLWLWSAGSYLTLLSGRSDGVDDIQRRYRSRD